MRSTAQELAHHFRNRAALFGLRAERGFALGPSRIYSEFSELYKTMAHAADEVGILARLTGSVEQRLGGTYRRSAIRS